MYHIQVDKTKRDNLTKYLKDKNIYTSFRYYPLHKVKYFDEGLVLKNTEDIMNRTLCIPLHQSLTDDDVNYIMYWINPVTREHHPIYLEKFKKGDNTNRVIFIPKVSRNPGKLTFLSFKIV